MAKNLELQTTIKISVPSGTNVIRNDDWITLARKKGDVIYAFTCPTTDINKYDLNENKVWVQFNKFELIKLAAL
jgi:hypothetical protein